MSTGHLYVFFGKMPIPVLCSFLNQIFCMNFFLHIFDINPFSKISFANILSHSVGCLFFFPSLCKSVLVLCGSIFLPEEINYSPKYYQILISTSILPMFSPRSFTVSGFNSFIYFEFFFAYDVRKWSRFILLYQLSSFPAPLSEETVFSPLFMVASFVID